VIQVSSDGAEVAESASRRILDALRIFGIKGRIEFTDDLFTTASPSLSL
jgi:hypothetical protein